MDQLGSRQHSAKVVFHYGPVQIYAPTLVRMWMIVNVGNQVGAATPRSVP